WALCLGQWSRRIGTVIALGLIISTAYQGWAFIAQQIVTGRARAMLEGADMEPYRLLATPTPLNSYFWRVLALRNGHYLNIYLPVFGGPEQITAYRHPRGVAMAPCLSGNGAFEKLAWFSRGYFRLDWRQNEVVFSDLRMGLTPNYVFQYAVAQYPIAKTRKGAMPPLPTAPPRRLGGLGGAWEDIEWLAANLFLGPAIRPAEADARIDIAALAQPPEVGISSTDCKAPGKITP
ncbi:MAG: hypothetical protein QGF20_05050, partial [Alphaproteobacteria bacterium]|nr:hypothetical protein [Alphaproteobacteria bacterium]